MHEDKLVKTISVSSVTDIQVWFVEQENAFGYHIVSLLKERSISHGDGFLTPEAAEERAVADFEMICNLERDGYDIAQICASGHLANDSWLTHPENNQDFCIECGERTIVRCRDCNWFIRGDRLDTGFATYHPGFTVPRRCIRCGSAFPWTAERINTAKELADLSEKLSKKEIEDMKKSIDDIVRDTPRTEVAATKFKLLIAKAGPEVAKGITKAIADLIVDAAKRIISPP
jgi:hypothetical protein